MSGHLHRHDHDHPHHGPGRHEHDLRGTSQCSLVGALVLITGYMVAEIVGGILSGSLSLLADAGHMLTDAASIALALVALVFSHWPASAERTFGYRRLETLAALINALTLWLVAGGIIIEAYQRFGSVPDVDGGLMLGVGSVGLVVNILAALILHRSAKHSINVEGALRYVMADLMGSVGVVVSGGSRVGLWLDISRSHSKCSDRHSYPVQYVASPGQSDPDVAARGALPHRCV